MVSDSVKAYNCFCRMLEIVNSGWHRSQETKPMLRTMRYLALEAFPSGKGGKFYDDFIRIVERLEKEHEKDS